MFKEFIKHLFPRITLKKNLRFTYTLCLGGLSFTAFIMLVISGVLLAIYYIPEPNQAYDSIIFIEENVSGGKYKPAQVFKQRIFNTYVSAYPACNINRCFFKQKIQLDYWSFSTVFKYIYRLYRLSFTNGSAFILGNTDRCRIN